MRLTRAITTDDIGQWHVIEPCRRRWPSSKYVDGLECPHCVGTWVGAAVVAGYVAAKAFDGRSRRPSMGGGQLSGGVGGVGAVRAWEILTGILTLNTVSVTLGRHLDYWS